MSIWLCLGATLSFAQSNLDSSLKPANLPQETFKATAPQAESISFGGSLNIQGVFSVNGAISLTIDGAIGVESGGDLHINGPLFLDSNFTNFGIAQSLTGQLNLFGETDQFMIGSFSGTNNLHKMAINKSSGNVELMTDLLITDSLMLYKGFVFLKQHNITFGAGIGAPATFDAVNAYVITDSTGQLIKSDLLAGQSIEFPVAPNVGEYTPALISGSASHLTDTVEVRVMRGLPATIDGFDPTAEINNTCRFVDATWVIDEGLIGGVQDDSVQVQWLDIMEGNQFTESAAKLYRLQGGEYFEYGDESATANTALTTQATGFGIFVVGETTPQVNPLASAEQSATVCSTSDTINLFDLATDINNHSGLWIDRSTGKALDSLIQSDTLIAGIHDFLYSLADSGGCIGDTLLLHLNASQNDWLHADVDTTVCQNIGWVEMGPLFINHTNDNIGWSYPANEGLLNGDSLDLTGITIQQDTTIEVLHISNDSTLCPADTIIVTIDIERIPVAGTNTVMDLCNNQGPLIAPEQLQGPFDFNGSWSITSGGVNFGNDTIYATSSIPGPYELTYTVSGTDICPAVSTTLSGQINPIINSISTNEATVCFDSFPLDLTDFMTPDASSGVWSVGGTILTGTSYAGVPDLASELFTFINNAADGCYDPQETMALAYTGRDFIQTHTYCGSDAVLVDLDSIVGHQLGSWVADSLNSMTQISVTVGSAVEISYQVPAAITCTSGMIRHQIVVNDTPIAVVASDFEYAVEDLTTDLIADLGGANGIWSFTSDSAKISINSGILDLSALDPGVQYPIDVIVQGACNLTQNSLTVERYVNCRPDTLIEFNTCPLPDYLDLESLLTGNLNIEGQWSDISTGMIAADSVNLMIGDTVLTREHFAAAEGICPQSTVELSIAISPYPVVPADLDTTICSEESDLVLNELFAGSHPGGLWTNSTGDTILEISSTFSGTQVLSYEPQNNCPTAPAVVVVNWLPRPQVALSTTGDIIIDQSVNLIATVDGATQYYWDGNQMDIINLNTSVIARVDHGFERFFTVDEFGCLFQDSIEVVGRYELDVPGAFTPNGDGYNDFFEIKQLAFFPMDLLTVYGRYGSILFQTNNPDDHWDGTFEGQTVPFGTYVFVITFSSDKQAISGTISVIR